MIKLYLAACTKATEHDIGIKLAYYAIRDAYGLDAPLNKDERGKPYFDGADVHISISHSHERCLAAISDSEVGADIEYKNGTDERLTRLAKRFFTEGEAAYVDECPRERFYEIWCAKESYIKYTGEGFSRPLSSFSVLESDMCFSRFDCGGYTVCVCSRERTDEAPLFIADDILTNQQP